MVGIPPTHAEFLRLSGALRYTFITQRPILIDHTGTWYVLSPIQRPVGGLGILKEHIISKYTAGKSSMAVVGENLTWSVPVL